MQLTNRKKEYAALLGIPETKIKFSRDGVFFGSFLYKLTILMSLKKIPSNTKGYVGWGHTSFRKKRRDTIKEFTSILNHPHKFHLDCYSSKVNFYLSNKDDLKMAVLNYASCIDSLSIPEEESIEQMVGQKFLYKPVFRSKKFLKKYDYRIILKPPYHYAHPSMMNAVEECLTFEEDVYRIFDHKNKGDDYVIKRGRIFEPTTRDQLLDKSLRVWNNLSKPIVIYTNNEAHITLVHLGMNKNLIRSIVKIT